MAQIISAFALLSLSVASDRAVRVASEYAKLSVDQQLSFYEIGTSSRRLMVEVESPSPNRRMILRLQETLLTEGKAMQALTDRMNAAVSGRLGRMVFTNPALNDLYSNAFTQLDVFFDDIQTLGTIPYESLLSAQSYANRIDLVISPIGMTARGIETLSLDVQDHAESLISKLSAFRIALAGVIVATTLALGVFLVLPALRDLDLSVRREHRLMKQMEEMTRLDQMTGLLNRTGLEKAIKLLGRKTPYAFAIVDLNNFKPINDTFGHAAGDQVLIETANRIQGASKNGVVSRLGGDEFCVLEVSTKDECEALGRRLASIFEKPMRYGTRSFQVSATIGIAHSDELGGDFNAVASAADSAMYDLKGTRNVLVGYYSPHLAAKMYSLQRKEELELALKAYDIRPWYQPKVNLRTREICGFEALARWHHRTDGILMPAMFLEDVTRYKLQLELTNSMVRQVLQQLRDWREQGFSPLPVSINISPEILALEETANDLLASLSEYQDVANLIIMEITEEVFIGRIAEAVRNSIRQIEEHGVQIAIDDFGSGYASFRHLREFPLHELKIDQSFVSDIGKSDSNEVILKAFMSIARGLEVAVVAEGVETEAQCAFLVSLGCKIGQGFLFSPALEAGSATVWLNDISPDAWREIS
ncbi:MAG: putative bifunctional diguanylate cyclase/phosphodiesterase [Roseobacter sp.]